MFLKISISRQDGIKRHAGTPDKHSSYLTETLQCGIYAGAKPAFSRGGGRANRGLRVPAVREPPVATYGLPFVQSASCWQKGTLICLRASCRHREPLICPDSRVSTVGSIGHYPSNK